VRAQRGGGGHGGDGNYHRDTEGAELGIGKGLDVRTGNPVLILRRHLATKLSKIFGSVSAARRDMKTITQGLPWEAVGFEAEPNGSLLIECEMRVGFDRLLWLCFARSH